MKKRVLVIGASPKPHRFSHMAIKKLLQNEHEVFAIGNREDLAAGIPIQKGFGGIENIDTITLYINKGNQKPIENTILELNPKRIIFNPGAENSSLASKAKDLGIEVVSDCTLVMLGQGSF
jgi:predicted CoA-binding protein